MSDQEQPCDVTPEMVAAGEAVLDGAFEADERSPSWNVLSAARDVYIAMERERIRSGNR
jgi:hypothetical protein